MSSQLGQKQSKSIGRCKLWPKSAPSQEQQTQPQATTVFNTLFVNIRVANDDILPLSILLAQIKGEVGVIRDRHLSPDLHCGENTEMGPENQTGTPERDVEGARSSRSDASDVTNEKDAEGAPSSRSNAADADTESPMIERYDNGSSLISGSKLTASRRRNDSTTRMIRKERFDEDAQAEHTNKAQNGGGRPNRSKRGHRTSTDTLPSLTAVEEDGSFAVVKVLVSGKPFSPSGDFDKSKSLDAFVGNDGNQYYCQVCREFGNVVCCDGCPRVYHQKCIPPEDPSRKSLENDDDPWFCPECIAKSYCERSRKNTEKVDRKSSRHRCVECHMRRIDLSLEPCEECGNYVHYPSCREDDDGRRICSTCRAVDNLTKDEGSYDSNGGGKDNLLEARNSADDDDDEEEEILDEGHGSEESTSKKKRNNPSKSKKRKKRKRRATFDGQNDVSLPSASAPPLGQRMKLINVPQATPAFIFYLGENRWKIERVLARKHRYFNRLPKGDERNALVAQEAAVWWSKLRLSEHRRYINLSMRDYEARIVQWKEEKTLREMGSTENIEDTPAMPTLDALVDDNRLTVERHQRLYLGTSVGSKPFKAENDQSYNRVLLDILHDMRFHPVPMFSITRPEDYKQNEEQSTKATIPYFDVHGPISTSVGDECLGCSRGWTHFCSVLKRRMPSVEHRAKLQPPLSSLAATRIGLGLRPHLERFEDFPTNGSQDSDLLSWRESGERDDIQKLPVLPSSSLSDPSERADDIVEFIEETMYMKVAEPQRLDENTMHSPKSSLAGRTLPTYQRKGSHSEGDDNGGSGCLNKCGRCRAVIESDKGCVQCRRAQLVINMSKRQPSAGNPKSHKGDSKILKVHTTMLGRVQMKEGSEPQAEGDLSVANAVLRERWTPSCILPPSGAGFPSRKAKPFSSKSEDLSCTSEETDETISYDSGNDEGTGSIEQPQAAGSPDDRPIRSARLTPGSSLDFSDLDERQKKLENQQRQTIALQKKALSIACFGILLALMRRDPLLLFAEPVTAEGYSALVKKPIDFGMIRTNVLSEKYSSLGGFVADVRLLCDNALLYNPSGSIYWKTAKELHDALGAMQKRATSWMGDIKVAYTIFLSGEESCRRFLHDSKENDIDNESYDSRDPFEDLRLKCPDAVAMLESGDWLRKQVEGDFKRTQENETAFYGSLAVRRVAAAAEACLAPYTDSNGVYSAVSMRSHFEDEGLRNEIDKRVSSIVDPVQLKDISSWREESVVRLVRKVQSRRLERKIVSDNGCARCDVLAVDQDMKQAMNADSIVPGRKRKNDSDNPRVDFSRMDLTTGLASTNSRERIIKLHEELSGISYDKAKQVCVSVRGSKVHGWGLFADQPFIKGDVVAEYLGEYISYAVADNREKIYQEQRIQDYQFRLDEKLVIDATLKGGPARYINHNCTPNCFAKIVSGEPPSPCLKRVIIIAQQEISINEEISYDYQFPLELDLSERIPCNCQSDACRGFMNWDLPEKGSNNRALLIHKRGANMRDRIRRLGRPLKRNEA